MPTTHRIVQPADFAAASEAAFAKAIELARARLTDLVIGLNRRFLGSMARRGLATSGVLVLPVRRSRWSTRSGGVPA